MSTYWARMRPGEDGSPVGQNLFDHLRGTAELARIFADAFGAGGLAACMGLLHDVGKLAPGWQGALRRANGIDDPFGWDDDAGRGHHSSLGAVVLPGRGGIWGPTERMVAKVVAYVVAGHHAGLPDWDGGDDRATLMGRLMRGGASLRGLLDEVRRDPAVGRYLDSVAMPRAPRDFSIPRQEHIHLWIRMLFSCLVDADRLDTERFMRPDIADARAPTTSLLELKEKLDRHMAEKAASSGGGRINDVRARVLALCREAARKPPGAYALRVPTGAGKTLASMTFALDHAVRHGRRRVIIVAPYTSIIEQTAGVLEEVFGMGNVVQHHSAIDPDRLGLRGRLAAENWDAPVIVTTNVRFFESLAAADPSACRRLHNIVNSVVILDEAHVMPSGYLESAERTLRALVENFGVTVLKCSATLPAGSGSLGGGCAAFGGMLIPEEICGAGRDGMFAVLRRTRIELPEGREAPGGWEGVAARVAGHGRALCVVDTRRGARDLHALLDAMRLDGRLFHLSALMCANDRRDVIAAVREALAGEGDVRVVSTQIVEAGVDIDFPVVFRAFAGLDSIVQTAGRCNREGRLEEGVVHVFNAPAPPPPGILRKGAAAARRILGDMRELTPSDDLMDRYFRELYADLRDLDTPDSRGRMFMCDRNGGPLPRAGNLEYAFRTYGREYAMIDDGGQAAVIVPYRNGELLEELEGRPARDTIRRLQGCTVNLRQREFDALRGAGMLRGIGGGTCFVLDGGCYAPGLGVRLDGIL